MKNESRWAEQRRCKVLNGSKDTLHLAIRDDKLTLYLEVEYTITVDQLKKRVKLELNKEDALDVYKIVTQHPQSNEDVQVDKLSSNTKLNTLNLNNLDCLLIGWNNQPPVVQFPIFQQDD